MKKFLCLLFISLSLYSQPKQIDWLEIHNLSMTGINELYNLNFNRAREIFNQIINKAPGDPRGYFFTCMQYYYKFSIEKNQVDYNNFLTSSEKVIEICEGLIDQNKTDYTSRFYLAGIYGYRGLLYQLNGSILKSVWDGKKGFGMMQDLVQEKPDYYDAYLGTGLFNYLLSKIPSGYAWVLKLLGYSGDRELGLKQLKTAEQNGIYTKSEAAYYLAQFQFNEKRYDEAFYYIKKLMKQYPDDHLFLAFYAKMELALGKPEYAITPCRKAIEIINRKKIASGDEVVYDVLASSLFSMNNFKEAAETYEISIKKTSNPDKIRNQSYYLAGISYDFSNQREKAIKAYKLCKKIDKAEWNSDALMYQLCQYYINNSPGENFKEIIMTENKYEQKKFDEAISGFNSILQQQSLSNDEKIIAYYMLGLCYSEKSMFMESIDAFSEGLKYQPVLRTHLTAQQYLKKGQSLIKLKRNNEGRAYLNKALDFDDYYYQKSIKESIKEELKKID